MIETCLYRVTTSGGSAGMRDGIRQKGKGDHQHERTG
jgi:hypothetical protein